MAAAFLARRGARVLVGNVRSGRGEIDLIVTLEGRLVAVEVKTRVGEDPIVQLTDQKRRRMRQAAARLRPTPERIDLVTVTLGPGGATISWVRAVA
ncbi:MAG: YraN family protein [Acidimicrobiia bacterium]|nr:MAG: YraN family protein [Acidimicrobiia bacterium]